jgi:dipeptidase E
MKLLLTSAGTTSESIANALRELLGKPTKEAKIAVIPTAHNAETGDKGWMIEENLIRPYVLGWKEFSIIDLAAVTSLDRDLWWPQLEQADVLLVGGGNTFYLSHWMQASGVFDALPKWLESKIYVGISAGSQIVGDSLRVSSEAIAKGEQLRAEYDELGPQGQSSSKTLKLVDFALRPHLNSPNFPKIREAFLARAAAKLDVPMYALDDQSSIKVINDKIEVISEGTWRLFDQA